MGLGNILQHQIIAANFHLVNYKHHQNGRIKGYKKDKSLAESQR
ncbi:MAG: hypothetical protein ACTHLL_03285 [Candidatus Nitrosocosmicus sp.]